MAEIYRVGILLLTLLPYLFWLPSGGSVKTGSTGADNRSITVATTSQGSSQPTTEEQNSRTENPCLLPETPCGVRGRCTYRPDIKNYECVCRSGYSGRNCTEEVDDDPCKTSPPCSGNGNCYRSDENPDGDQCVCNPGWSGTKCNEAGDPCERNSSLCQPHGRCEYNSKEQKRYRCRCIFGWFGDNCEKEGDPCESNSGLCRPHGRCESSSEGDEGYHCVCDYGWSEKDCSKADPPSLWDASYTEGDLRIVDLLTVYFSSDCKVALAESDEHPASVEHNRKSGVSYEEAFTPGQRRITILLSSYFLSDCKGSVDAHLDEVMQNPAYKDGEKQIIKILSSYFSSGCDDANTVAKQARAVPSANYTRGEVLSLNLLSSFLASGCKGSDVFKTVSGNETLTSSGCRVRFFVLELFLPIAGVYLTQIDL